MKMKKKNPFLGGLLNVLIPGLANVYMRQWGNAIATFVGAIMFIGLLVWVNGQLTDPPWPDFVCPGLLGLLYIGLMFFGGWWEVRKFNAGISWGKCPYCQASTDRDALTCPSCGRDLRNLPEGMHIEYEPPQQKRISRMRLVIGLLGLLCLMLVIAGAILHAAGII